MNDDERFVKRTLLSFRSFNVWGFMYNEPVFSVFYLILFMLIYAYTHCCIILFPGFTNSYSVDRPSQSYEFCPFC